MEMYERRLQTLEHEIMRLRIAIEQFMVSKHTIFTRKPENKMRLLDLFGEWDGDIEAFLSEFYARRERRGRRE